MKTMPVRLKHLRIDKLGLTQSDFAARIGLKSASIVHHMESGSRKITERTIRSICNEFRVSRDWIKNGTPPIFTMSIEENETRFNPQGGWQPRSIEEMAGVPKGLGMGRAVDMLASIYNSKNQEVIRAINANLQVFCTAVEQAGQIDQLKRDMDDLRDLVKKNAKLHAYYGDDRRSSVDRRQVAGESPTGSERRRGEDRRRTPGDNGSGI
jgi:transcriptional regulator with XRE-family HTH domain